MKWEWKRELPLLAIVIAGFVVSLIVWDSVPERIPVHFDASGEVDRYGSRALGLLMLPGVALAIYLMFWILPKIDPGRSNYSSFSTTYHLMRYATVGLMFAIHLVIVAIALGAELSVNLIIPQLVGLLFLVLGNVMGKVRPNWFVGIRTPWTLSSKRSWDRTHRVGGRGMMALGLVIMVLGFIGESWTIGALGALVALYVVGLTVYSWYVWRNDPNPTSPADTDAADGSS